MNSSFVYGPGAMCVGPGQLIWDEHGRVLALTAGGHPAVAGDGLAVAIVSALADNDATDGTWFRRCDTTLPPLTGDERALSADVDMTNWNVVVDNRFIVKVTGRLGDGDRAAHLVRAITRQDPDLVPRLYGTLDVTTRAGTAVIASVTELRAAASDGWTWAVGDLHAHLTGGPAPAWPSEIGRLLARMHAALYRDLGRDGHRNSIRDADGEVRALDDLAMLADASTPSARRLLARRRELDTIVRTIPAISRPCIPLHGDCHVGQILRDDTMRYTIIDFDGDPQGATGDADVAVDVAHMLVSIDMVAAVVAKYIGRDDPRLVAWSSAAHHELVSAYQAEARRRELPHLLDEARLPGLMAVQFIRELTYARDYLPRWEYAADWAITHRYSATPDLEDPPWTPPALPTT